MSGADLTPEQRATLSDALARTAPVSAMGHIWSQQADRLAPTIAAMLNAARDEQREHDRALHLGVLAQAQREAEQRGRQRVVDAVAAELGSEADRLAVHDDPRGLLNNYLGGMKVALTTARAVIADPTAELQQRLDAGESEMTTADYLEKAIERGEQ